MFHAKVLFHVKHAAKALWLEGFACSTQMVKGTLCISVGEGRGKMICDAGWSNRVHKMYNCLFNLFIFNKRE